MSAAVGPVRGEFAGGLAVHLQCPQCGHFSSCHSHHLTHIAASHPTLLDGAAVGRLGNILMYQSGARLFHCADCFYTTREFTKLYRHVVSKHCTDQPGGGGQGSDKEEEEEEEEEREEVKASVGAEQAAAADSVGFRCLICGWKNKVKALSIRHVVQKHDIPKAYASQALRREVQEEVEEDDGCKEEEVAAAAEAETAGLSGELLKKEEAEALARVVRFNSNRYVCIICGWKAKIRGFAISHVVRFHDVERPYRCKNCPRTFFLPSRLQQHVRTSHRPGRYSCPFCCFRSHFLGGFRRHCSRCNARVEGGGAGAGKEEEQEEQRQQEEREERKEVSGGRTRRRTRRAVEEEENQENQDDLDDLED